MNERRLRAALRRTRPPDVADARERARAVARASYASRAPGTPPRPRRIGLPAAVMLAAALVALVITLTPPGDAVADWVRDLVRGASDPPRPQPALARLPGDGRLLVSGPGGSWIVHRDGSRRRLGGYREATWSPQGRFVGATRGRDLVAVDPQGAIRWVLSRPAAVHDPRWSPSGFRIAYRSGAGLRVVAGDGSGDRLVARRVPAIAAAWRPAAHHVLSYVDRSRRIVISDLDATRRLGRLRAGIAVRRLEWSQDGNRLLVAGRRSVRLLDASGRVVTALDARAGTEFLDAKLSPGGGQIAIAARHVTDGRHEVLLASARRPRLRLRSVFRAVGSIRSVTWAPDRRIVLADWVGTDQWLFLPTGRGAAATAVGGIAAHFSPGRGRSRAAVRVESWCCP